MTTEQTTTLQNKTVLVTGGAGFIGSNLCETLLKNNIKVICLDNFATGKRENIAPFLKNKQFQLIEGDIRNLNDCHIICISSIKLVILWKRSNSNFYFWWLRFNRFNW